jgi:hypothetical protein
LFPSVSPGSGVTRRRLERVLDQRLRIRLRDVALVAEIAAAFELRIYAALVVHEMGIAIRVAPASS